MPNQIHGHQIPDDVIIDCPKCKGSGWLAYDVDVLGYKTEIARCNEPGCVGGEITTPSPLSTQQETK